MSSPVHSSRLIAATLLGLSALPMSSHATIIFTLDKCNSSSTWQACDQTVNFSPASSGTTVIGDTNPPKPDYQVFVEDLTGLTLHASGSSVDTGVHGPGFTSILITPEAGYAWGSIEFMLDSMDKDQLTGPGLTLTAIDQFDVKWIFNTNFPYEGDKGENQHYSLHGLDGQVITSLQIDYRDPDPACRTDPTQCNTINDIHNIDVGTQMVPEPGSLALFGAGLTLAGVSRRRLRQGRR